MTEALTQFVYDDQPVRVIEQDGEVWFVAADVARVLGYREAFNMTRALDDDQKGPRLVRTLGGEQTVLAISEPGFYSAVMNRQTGRMVDSATKQSVKQFQRWVYHEVLPSIRRHGGYLTEAKVEEILTDPDTLIQLATNLKEERAARRQAEIQRDEITRYAQELEPKSEYFDSYVRPEDKETVKDWANKFGLTEPQAYAKLLSANLVYKKDLGARWSKSQHKYVPIREYRPRAGKPSFDWFMLMPQHNAPRLTNGRVRQTLYVRNRHIDDLARKIGLSRPAEQTELVLIDDYRDEEIA